MLSRRFDFIRFILPVFASLAFLTGGCRQAQQAVSGPLTQRGYLWQREWTPAVIDAAVEADRRMDGVVILGAEILWEGGRPRVVRANIRWEAVKAFHRKCAIALRVAPYPGPFSTDDAAARVIAGTAKSLLADARAHSVSPDEFELDFHCAQKNLAGYRAWLGLLRPLVHPARFVITTLPSWLDQGAFPDLIRAADGYVLQVHSVPTREESGRASLCDPALARKWVAKAAKLGVPFSVALPTYRCLAGYDPAGKLLGVAMDSVQQAWPPGTQVLEFATDADGIAALVHEWQSGRPQAMRELLWYRVPVATDALNWRWPTLAAVMAGRKPAHKLVLVKDGENPVDIALANQGEAEESFAGKVSVGWKGAAPVSSDALPGWKVDVGSGVAVFTQETGHRVRVSPGGRRGIGWIRFEKTTVVELHPLELIEPAEDKKHGESSR